MADDARTRPQHGLQKLAETICETVVDAKQKGTIQPEQEPFWQVKVNDFQYTDGGITQARSERTMVTKTTWIRASAALRTRVFEDTTFLSTLADLEAAFPDVSDMRQHLETFAGSIFQRCLGNDQDRELQGETDSTIEKFLGELSGRVVTYRAKVELSGVVLRPRSVSLEAGITIRQPVKEDIEKTFRAFSPLHRPFETFPSAILEVELRANRGRNALLQAKVEHCVALLRLFKVGGAKWTSYDMSSDSLLDVFGGTLGSGTTSAALETYVITREEEVNLKRFWETLSVLLPKNVYDFDKQINHITLAYDRYSDGLLQNGIIERRIANAVMGFEALFLEETQELSYRLRLRISKILSMVGRNPLQVRETIKDAYEIRSTFAHGGHLDHKNKKPLERKYGDVKSLLHSTLDYLRLSIIIMILSRTSKEELVDLIDDALLDSDKNQQLQGRVSGAKALLA